MDIEPDNDCRYARFDKRTDVLSSLEPLKLALLVVRDNPLLWKWAIIGAHDALQAEHAAEFGLSSAAGSRVEGGIAAVLGPSRLDGLLDG